LGFSSIFALVGVLLNRALGATAYALQVWLSRLGGLVIIFFALSIMGV
ncbi:cytochrome C biogenesis protein, partial [Candidatus Woesearchaeota archaeon CG11_big_fil_rev_8_21_14_0_20_57_5]